MFICRFNMKIGLDLVVVKVDLYVQEGKWLVWRIWVLVGELYSIKILFNQAKITRLKITRYQSRLDNLLAYKNNNLIPKGLKPKCTPAIHSCNPSFWSKWRENLDNLASVQLDLLLDETNNCIRQLKSTFDKLFIYFPLTTHKDKTKKINK